MRVIAGKLGGRHFDAPTGHKTHPMSDKARGGLFNVLGDISDLTVLDAFAGSGALSIEAISRGGKSSIAVDSDKNAVVSVTKSLKELGLVQAIKIVQANVGSWSDNNPDTEFDLVFCDPPYDKVQLGLLQKLSKHVVSKGLFVLSWPGNFNVPEFAGLEHIKTQKYGDAQLAFYRRIS